MHRQDDFLGEERRRFDLLRRLQEPAVLVLGEISQSRVVFVEELHATDGIRSGQITRHAPIEECLQDREILVDGRVSDFLGAPQFDVFNQRGRNLR